jgi:hypothetical protein
MRDKAAPGRPPRAGQFHKGKSGNPKGRPKSGAEPRTSAFDVIIDKTLTVTRNGAPRQITMEEALQHRTYQDAVNGKLPAQREVMKWITKREKYLDAKNNRKTLPAMTLRHSSDPENADEALLLLGITGPDPYRQDFPSDRAQMLLETWAVQAALSRRRGGSKLTEKEVMEIRRCTRDPDSLRWPKGARE